MASYTVAKGALAKHAFTMVASTVDTVAFADDLDEITIISLDGAAEIYFTVDGSTPTVAGANTRVMPAALGEVTLKDRRTGGSIVKLISSGTPKVSVQKAV